MNKFPNVLVAENHGTVFDGSEIVSFLVNNRETIVHAAKAIEKGYLSKSKSINRIRIVYVWVNVNGVSNKSDFYIETIHNYVYQRIGFKASIRSTCSSHDLNALRFRVEANDVDGELTHLTLSEIRSRNMDSEGNFDLAVKFGEQHHIVYDKELEESYKNNRNSSLGKKRELEISSEKSNEPEPAQKTSRVVGPSNQTPVRIRIPPPPAEPLQDFKSIGKRYRKLPVEQYRDQCVVEMKKKLAAMFSFDPNAKDLKFMINLTIEEL